MNITNLTDITNITALETSTLTFAEAKVIILPLFLFVMGMVVYAIFVFKFYRFLAKKDILELNLRRYSQDFLGFLGIFFGFLLYIIEYILIFPLFIFFWFIVLATMLSLMSKNSLPHLLLIAMALVAAVRVTAYYNEDLSKDLAKMFPFAVLGVYLVDFSLFSLDKLLDLFYQLPSLGTTLAYYLIFIMIMEILLRIISLPFHKQKTIEQE